MHVLRAGLTEWLKSEGFKRLGSNGWIRSAGEVHHIIAIQCRQSGWDPHAGNSFVVEFEQSRTPSRVTGFGRARIWSLLDDVSRRDALDINSQVAQTLPPPDQRTVRSLPADLRDHYLRRFAATTQTVDSGDVWFAYYDEADAAAWANFLARTIGPTLDVFLAQPPSFFGHRAGPAED